MLDKSLLINLPLFQELAISALSEDLWLFCKNGNASYLDGNERIAQDLSLASHHDIKKMTDYDFGWSQQRIHFLREWDLEVSKNETPIYKLEDPFSLPNGENVQVFTYKTPLRNTNSQIMGIAGISIKLYQSAVSPTYNLFRFLNPNSFNQFHLDLTKKINVPITKRESECLFYLIQGKTAREIGHYLYISKRTVECYVNSIKEKMHCRKKSELINKILKLLTA